MLWLHRLIARLMPNDLEGRGAAALPAGAPAPDFALAADDGSVVKLRTLRGRPVVLFFYPKDDSPT